MNMGQLTELSRCLAGMGYAIRNLNCSLAGNLFDGSVTLDVSNISLFRVSPVRLPLKGGSGQKDNSQPNPQSL